MTGVSIGMFHVENFLCCIKLRGGTLFSLCFTMIFSFFAFLLIFNASRQESGHPLALSIEGTMIIGILVSGYALLYFPEMNKKYNENSVNAKCVKYFSIFCGVMAILGILVWFAIIILEPQYLNTMFLIALIESSWIGIFTHFTAVTYSFYRSILESDNDHGERSLTTNNIYDEVLERNNARLGKMNDEIPQLLISSPSVNGNGNQYVELR